MQVIERAPIISTTSAKVKETFDANFVDAIPLDKRTGYGGFIRDNVPGAADGGGEFAGSDWLARVRGANTNQNAILVEGFRMDWHKITLNSLAAMEVLTAGNGADNAGTPGAVVNMVTQCGLEPLPARRHRLARGRAPAPVHHQQTTSTTTAARASSTPPSRARSSRTSSGSI